MAEDKDIHEKGQEFLHALRPKPAPPASRQKKEDMTAQAPDDCNNDAQADGFSEDEYRFLKTYVLDKSNSASPYPTRQVLITSELHEKLQRFVKTASNQRGALSNFLNNVLTNFLKENDGVLQSIFAKCNNKKL